MTSPTSPNPAPTSPVTPPAQAPEHHNRVYIGEYHQPPTPDTPIHVGSDGKRYYIPDEVRQPQEQQQISPPPEQQQEQNEYAERYANAIAALKEQLEAYTHEIQQHIQSAGTEPVDADHLKDLNDKVQQIQQELQVAQANYDQAMQGQQHSQATAPAP